MLDKAIQRTASGKQDGGFREIKHWGINYEV